MTEDSHNTLYNFFKKYPSRKYSRGQILLHFDDPLQNIYYLESGRVRQYNITEKGNEVVLNIYRSRSFFPVSLALNNSPSKHIYETMSKSEIRKAPVQEFMKFFSSSPNIVLDHLKDVYSRSNKAIVRMNYMVASTAYYRIIFELVNECSYMQPKKDGSYQMNIHEYEIAECAGLSRETVSREFKKLTQKGIVKVSHRSITVRDLNKLKLELEGQI